MTVTCKKELGQLAEQRALVYLQKNGLVLLLQNFRCKLGEIDLIMREGADIIFVEVRSRKSAEFGTAVESVTYRKQQKIYRTAIYFLQNRRWLDKVNFRFDIIGIQNNQIEWIKNAFTPDYRL